MPSKNHHVIESDIFDINDNNIGEKFRYHFAEVLKFTKYSGIKNAKVVTRIRELTAKEASISTDIEEELKRMAEK